MTTPLEVLHTSFVHSMPSSIMLVLPVPGLQHSVDTQVLRSAQFWRLTSHAAPLVHRPAGLTSGLEQVPPGWQTLLVQAFASLH